MWLYVNISEKTDRRQEKCVVAPSLFDLFCHETTCKNITLLDRNCTAGSFIDDVLTKWTSVYCRLFLFPYFANEL